MTALNWRSLRLGPPTLFFLCTSIYQPPSVYFIGIQVRGHAIGRFVTNSFGLWIDHLFAGMLSAVLGQQHFLEDSQPHHCHVQPCGYLLFDICCREEEWKCLHLDRRFVPSPFTAGCLTRTIWQACVVVRPFFLRARNSSTFPLIWAQKFFSRSHCPCDSSGYLLASRANLLLTPIRHRFVLFSHNSGSVMRIATYTGSG